MEENEHPKESSRSPNGSQASQTSSQLNLSRIVKLLPETTREDSGSNQNLEDWTIRAEFYDEDIVAEDIEMEHQSDDDEFEDEVQGYGHRMYEHDPEHDEESFDDFDELDDDDIIDLGFIIAPNVVDSDSDSNDDPNENLEAVDYDITLPVCHRYLGEDLQESGSTQIFAENSTVKMPLFFLKHIVLLPGQTLPITTAAMRTRIQRFLRIYIAKGISIIGLMSDPRTNAIGTTAEIRNYSEQEDQLRLILEGRQRFKLTSQPFDSVVEGTVKILPEVTLGKPYKVPPSCQRFLVSQIPRTKKVIPTKHPMWLLRGYESSYISRKIVNHIKDWCSVDLTAKDPCDFSYWVAANLPISNQERMKILTFDCTEQRLLWLLEILEKSTSFACASCKNVICSKEDVLPMSSMGPQNSFVNPQGYVHDTLTVRTANGLIQEQEWSDEFSWFPGYQWRIACCNHCNRHIGWCYKSISAQTKPRKFFGLSRANVRLSEPDLTRWPTNDSALDESNR